LGYIVFFVVEKRIVNGKLWQGVSGVGRFTAIAHRFRTIKVQIKGIFMPVMPQSQFVAFEEMKQLSENS
jgi:hypothetical protein